MMETCKFDEYICEYLHEDVGKGALFLVMLFVCTLCHPYIHTCLLCMCTYSMFWMCLQFFESEVWRRKIVRLCETIVI